MEGLVHAVAVAGFPNAGEQEIINIPLDIPAAFRTCQHMNKTCPLIGCTLRASLDSSPYCCIGHREMARANWNSPRAFHYFDGFDLEKERQMCCLVALIQEAKGVKVGVPNFGTSVFTSPPWTQPKFFTGLKADWLFLVNAFERMPKMTVDNNGVDMIWHGQATRPFVVSCMPPDIHVTQLRYNIRVTPSDNATPEQSQAAQEQSLLANDWRLFKYQLNNMYLFCLTRHHADFTEPKAEFADSKTKKEEVKEDENAEAKEGGKKATGSKSNKKTKKGDVIGSGSGSLAMVGSVEATALSGFGSVQVVEHLVESTVDVGEVNEDMGQAKVSQHTYKTLETLNTSRC